MVGTKEGLVSIIMGIALRKISRESGAFRVDFVVFRELVRFFKEGSNIIIFIFRNVVMVVVWRVSGERMVRLEIG